MPVSDFKFVSPGVFINEIDNSFIPREADAIGPVVIGRATRGLAMQPVKVGSYSEFVEMFGDTVPGNGGGDIYRDGNFQSPMYGTYAAKAFLRSNVAPLTYIRLLGQQTSVGSAAAGDAASGWHTVTNAGAATNPINGVAAGGAFGLWIAKSSSSGIMTADGTGAAQLSAIIYVGSGSVMLSGSLAGHETTSFGAGDQVKGSSCLVESDTNGRFKLVVNGALNGEKIFTISMDEDSDEYYIRKVLSTNPQLTSTQGAFYPSASAEDYWLGETFEQEARDAELTSGNLVAFIGAIGSGSSASTGPHDMKSAPSQEAIAGWFIGQDLGTPADFNPNNAKKLFRFIGRGHGSWLHKNAKVSISNIKQTNTTTNEYGSFSVLIRKITDTDQNPEILERFDNCNLDPSSPNYVAKLIGDKYQEWDTTNKQLKEYGDYDNNSKYIRIDMNADVEAGATDPVLLPFGYYGPPKFTDVLVREWHLAKYEQYITGSFLQLGTASAIPGTGSAMNTENSSGILLGPRALISSSYGTDLTASVKFPSVRLRNKATDNVISDQTKAFFGIDTTRQTSATTPQAGIFDTHRLLYGGLANTNNVPTDPTSTTIAGVDGFSYIFTMDNLTTTSSVYTYLSASRTSNESVSAVSGYTALLDADINKFTAPFWGGFDGFDIVKPDPLYNGGMSSTSTEDDSYAYHTYTRAIQTVSDPEYINMNLLTVPGLTNTSLTSLMIDKCAERADALALIDLPDVYRPSHEQYYADKTSRIGTTPVAAANALKLRRIDSSYGATFYPWVKTVDANTSQLVWIPPTVAMMGVLASSERASEIWFAPAGFNRGGLTNGAAGIPITQVSERLSSRDRDTLYEARINPIASFPSEGIVVFGQKTLQERPSALDRINVRRLVIFLKKQISILSTQVLFEQNVEATWNNFRALIRPLLASVQTRLGITDYKLILDSTTTTPDLVDQNILYAKIMVKPARAIEYIAIDFVIASSGASFDD